MGLRLRPTCPGWQGPPPPASGLQEAPQVKRTECPEQSFTVLLLLEPGGSSFQSTLGLVLGQREKKKDSPGSRFFKPEGVDSRVLGNAL